MPASAVEIVGLSHRYGQRLALDALDLTIHAGEVFCLLGPNGGGKSTLFRLLSTLIPIQQGSARLLGLDLSSQAALVRRRIGVVFQSPSLDKKLTVRENLLHQGRLYGLAGNLLAARMDELLVGLRLTDRLQDRVETLSGGLRRRVDLAKGLLHRPELLLLDEPSTGLDPAARGDLWDCLQGLRREQAVTVVLTTHLLDEAEKADRLAILDAGRLVALDTPERLRSTVGGDSLTIETEDAAALSASIQEAFGWNPQVVDGRVRLEQPAGHTLIARLVEAFPGRVRSITLAQPSLEDVFIARTGRRFQPAADQPPPKNRGGH